jgi:hypothetical protein
VGRESYRAARKSFIGGTASVLSRHNRLTDVFGLIVKSVQVRQDMNSVRPKLVDDGLTMFSKGDRVHPSKLGCSRHPRDSQKRGTIVGPTRYPNSLRVVWDGSRWPIAVHRDYIQLFEEDASNGSGNEELIKLSAR